MSVATTGGDAQDDVDDRDRRAASEAMIVVPLAPGMFDVYSGETSRYTVDAVSGACECPAAVYQDGLCKHVRRVEMAIGERAIPDDVRVDSTLARRVEVDRDA